MNKEKLTDIVRDFLDEREYRYEYDAEHSIFRLGFDVKCRLKDVRVVMIIRDTSYSVVTISPLNADKEHPVEMMKYLTLANYGVVNGNFEMDLSDGEIRYKTYVDADGTLKTPIMSCYGIGVGRLMASVVENSHDDFGPIWPKSIAPFQVEIVPIGKEAELMELAEKFESELEAAGIDVLVDDRDERPGVKFKDADLWGSPVRIAIGKKGLANGEVEWKFRNEKEFTMVKVEDVIAKAKEYFEK